MNNIIDAFQGSSSDLSISKFVYFIFWVIAINVKSNLELLIINITIYFPCITMYYESKSLNKVLLNNIVLFVDSKKVSVYFSVEDNVSVYFDVKDNKYVKIFHRQY